MHNIITPNDPAHEGKFYSVCQATGIKTDLLGYQEIFKSKQTVCKSISPFYYKWEWKDFIACKVAVHFNLYSEKDLRLD